MEGLQLLGSAVTKAEIEAITPEGGDSVVIYSGSTDPAKRAMHLKVGSAAAPDEIYGAPIRVSRTSKTLEASFTGDGNMGLGAIVGTHVALAGSQGQALGGVFGAITHSSYVGEHSQADAFAFYAVGRSASDSTRTGAGGFILAQRNHVEGRATGLELTVENNASAAGIVLSSEYMNSMGFWVTPRGANDSAACFVIGHPTSRVFKIGWMAQAGSVSEATWRDYSNSTTSLDVRGEHESAIKLAPKAGKVDLGKNEMVNPGPLGNPYRILARASGNANTSAAEGNKYFLISGQTNAKEVNPQSTAAANLPYLIVIAGADLAGPGTTKMRTSATIVTAATAPGKTITVGLYPVTGAPTQTLGTVVEGSTANFASPAKESTVSAKSADFTPPADGVYALGYIVNGTPSGGFALQAAAEYHHV